MEEGEVRKGRRYSPVTSDIKFIRLQQILHVIVFPRNAATAVVAEGVMEGADTATVIYAIVESPDKCEWEEAEG